MGKTPSIWVPSWPHLCSAVTVSFTKAATLILRTPHLFIAEQLPNFSLPKTTLYTPTSPLSLSNDISLIELEFAMKPHSRKLLQDEDAVPRDTLSPPVTYSPDPLLQPMNGSSTTLSKTRPFRPNSPLDSSMALTALVLLTALFFMGFFSIYIRRFTADSPSASSRRRRRSPSYPSSSSLPPWRSTNFHKGLDPSAVRSLPLISYGGGAKHQIDCAICLAEFEERETVKLIPHCGHLFHPVCIDTWLSSRVTCPLCRSSRWFAVEEVRSVASRGEEDHGGGEDERGSTAEMDDTLVELSEVGPLRRACSCPSLGDQVVMQRSLGYFLTP